MRREQPQQHGMALVIVLWTIAVLSLFVATLGSTVRSEAGLANISRNLVQGRAMGEAAIYISLQRMRASHPAPSEQVDFQENWQGLMVNVEAVPWSSLININGATAEIWTMLLEKGAGLSRAQASALSEKILHAREEWRNKGLAWEAAEDLLQVEGMNYWIFQSIQPFIVIEKGSRSTVNIQGAPEPLKNWLQESGLASTQNTASSMWRFTAQVPINEEGSVWVERHFSLQKPEIKKLPAELIAGKQYWRAHR